jgi:hypothetical protein
MLRLLGEAAATAKAEPGRAQVEQRKPRAEQTPATQQPDRRDSMRREQKTCVVMRQQQR